MENPRPRSKSAARQLSVGNKSMSRLVGLLGLEPRTKAL